eukprot:m.215237 g.215237  ORF g.215237 m.215237 type:complete len:493 (-) comp25610_c0_seq1:257-1735(-)
MVQQDVRENHPRVCPNRHQVCPEEGGGRGNGGRGASSHGHRSRVGGSGHTGGGCCSSRGTWGHRVYGYSHRRSQRCCSDQRGACAPGRWYNYGRRRGRRWWRLAPRNIAVAGGAILFLGSAAFIVSIITKAGNLDELAYWSTRKPLDFLFLKRNVRYKFEPPETREAGVPAGWWKRRVLAARANVLGTRHFTYSEVEAATASFSENRVVSTEGRCGTVFKGTLDGGLVVAVKKMNQADAASDADNFEREVRVLSTCKHPNVLTLLGFSADGQHNCILYQYIDNGSLLNCLIARPLQLTWKRRHRILLDVSSAFEFLHQTMIVHRDVKSANILINGTWGACLGDFGIARRLADFPGACAGTGTRPLGELGYADPEYVMSGRVTLASDVYSFGVVCMEVLTGRRVVAPNQDPLKMVFEIAVEGNAVSSIVDPAVQFPAGLVGALTDIASRCTDCRGRARPAADALRAELELASQVDRLDDESTTVENPVDVCVV